MFSKKKNMPFTCLITLSAFSIASMTSPFLNPATTIWVVFTLSCLVFRLNNSKKMSEKVVYTHYRPSSVTPEGFQYPVLFKFFAKELSISKMKKLSTELYSYDNDRK